MSKFKNLIIIVGIMACVGFLLILPLIIKVKIVCTSQYGTCPDSIESGVTNKTPLSLYQSQNKINKFLKSQFMVAAFSTQIKLPDILIVNIIIKKPSFILKNETGLEISVGQDGKVLGSTKDSTLPEVDVTGNLKKDGETIDQEQLFALNLISGVNEMYQVRVGQIQDNTLVVELPMGIRVIFPLNGDSQVLLGSLRLIYSKIESENQNTRYSEIDLRFKNPVLKII